MLHETGSLTPRRSPYTILATDVGRTFVQHRIHPQLCQLNQMHHSHRHLAIGAGLVVGILEEKGTAASTGRRNKMPNGKGDG